MSASRKSGPSIGRIVATVTSVGVLGLTAVTGAVAFVGQRNYNVIPGAPIVHVNASANPVAKGQTYAPVNILVMGTDTRSGQGKQYGSASHYGGLGRSDTVLFVHIAANRKWAQVVSIPRDTTFHLPACAHAPTVITRFNAAFAGGGPLCTIKTVEQVTKMNIDHYVVVNFSGFKKVVNDLGGVPICTKVTIQDKLSGLYLSKGNHVLNGDQALGLMRARYTLGDGSDLSRITRQQVVLSSIIRKTISAGTLSNPVKATHVLGAISSTLTVDPGLANLQDAVNLGLTLQGIRPADIQFVRMPTLNNSDRATVRMSTSGIAMWATLAQDQSWPPLPKAGTKPKPGTVKTAGAPLKTPPSHIQVQVLNANGVVGAATALGNQLTAKGFVFLGAGDYKSGHQATTFVRYDPGWNESARTLAASLGGVKMVAVPGLKGTLQVVLGADNPKVIAVYVPTSTTTSPGTLPTTQQDGLPGEGITTAGAVKCITG